MQRFLIKGINDSDEIATPFTLMKMKTKREKKKQQKKYFDKNNIHKKR